MKKLLAMAAIILMSCLFAANANAASLTKDQSRRADKITRYCTDNYNKYGVLPSVCLGQAIAESSLGERCSRFNYWGINCCRTSYSSLQSGTLAYLKVINNGYYKKAPFEKNYRKQIRYIAYGGYCSNPGNYAATVTSIIKSYGLTRYDKQMRKTLRHRENLKKKAKESAKQKAKEKADRQGDQDQNDTPDTTASTTQEAA